VARAKSALFDRQNTEKTYIGEFNMKRKELFTALVFSVLSFSATALFADDVNPLSPAYKDAASKKYIMEFCSMDKNSDGFVSAAEFLNNGNPLSPGWEHNPKYSSKYKMWKEMCPEGQDKITMDQFMAYKDSHNPLSASYKK
jgi:hypothetical protein